MNEPKNKPALLILDTSLILELFKTKRFDLVELRALSGAKEVVLPKSVGGELEKLGRKDILGYLVSSGCAIAESGSKTRHGDREIEELCLKFAPDREIVIGTQDFALASKLKSFKGKFGHIFERGGKKLGFSHIGERLPGRKS